MLLEEKLTEEIVGSAIEVHRVLGPGLLESAYEECLCHELNLRGISFRRQVDLPVDIPRMAAAVSAMVRRALESFIEGKAELAQAVLEMDNVVDRMRDEAFIALVKEMNENPASTRQALDTLLVARNLERVADHATNIAEDVIFWVRGADVRHGADMLSAEESTGTH